MTLQEKRDAFVDALAKCLVEWMNPLATPGQEESEMAKRTAARALVAALDAPAPSVPPPPVPPAEFEIEAGRASAYLHSHGYKAEADLLLCLYRSHEEMKRRVEALIDEMEFIVPPKDASPQSTMLEIKVYKWQLDARKAISTEK